MPEAEHGFVRAISEVVGGLIMSLLLNAFASSGLIPTSYLSMFRLLNLMLTISFILAIPYLGTGYLLGWLFGLTMMAQTGLIDPLDFVIYFIIPAIILIVRIVKKIEFATD